jgi:hypothetical protein
MSIRRVLIALGVVAAALSVGGCGPDNCGYVCDRWQECVGGLKEGVNACASECAVKSDNDAVYRGHVEECAKCAESRSCSEATNDCFLDCTISIAR